jgi:hypothetical protein
MIERDGDVRDVTLAEQRQQRACEPSRGADFLARGIGARRATVVGPEQLEGPVDEVHIHGVPFSTMAGAAMCAVVCRC